MIYIKRNPQFSPSSFSDTNNRLSLDAIRVPSSAFSFAFSLAFTAGIFFSTSLQIRKSRFGGSFLILQVILRGLELGKVSAFRKCAGGTFSAGSARAVPHAQRGVSRAGSMQGEAAADGQVLLSAPKNSPHFCVGCFFVKTALHLFVIFFTIFRFCYCKMDFIGL